MFEFESLIPVGIKFQAGESVEFVTDVDSQWVKVAKTSDRNISALVPTTYVKGEIEEANVLYVRVPSNIYAFANNFRPQKQFTTTLQRSQRGLFLVQAIILKC